MIHLKEIDKIIAKSISINQGILNLLSQSNNYVIKLEKEFIDILINQNVNTFYKNLATRISEDLQSTENKNILSDLIHLFEFEKVVIKGFKTKILKCLNERRRVKMLVGYANRVQQERGFTNSIYWYNRHYNNSINSYTLKTDINSEFKKDLRISKKTIDN